MAIKKIKTAPLTVWDKGRLCGKNPNRIKVRHRHRRDYQAGSSGDGFVSHPDQYEATRRTEQLWEMAFRRLENAACRISRIVPDMEVAGDGPVTVDIAQYEGEDRIIPEKSYNPRAFSARRYVDFNIETADGDTQVLLSTPRCGRSCVALSDYDGLRYR